MSYTVQQRLSFHAVCTTHPGSVRIWQDVETYENRDAAERRANEIIRKNSYPSGCGYDVRIEVR